MVTQHILVVINGVTSYHFILAVLFALIQRVVFGPVLGICVGAARVFCVSVMNIANAMRVHEEKEQVGDGVHGLVLTRH